MDRNAKKHSRMQVFPSYAILVFQIFWQKKLSRGVRMVRSSKEKGAPYIVQSRSEAKLSQ